MPPRRLVDPVGPPWPELMTLTQASAYLNVPRQTLAFWTYRTRELPHVSLGRGQRRLCRIRKSVLDELITRGEQPALKVLTGGKR